MLAPDTILVNRYRIVQLLSQGGMGAVYEAIDQDLNCTVAVKETFAEAVEHRRFFKREASLLANLRHPALPKVTHHFVLKHGQFLVMEFISGKDLAQLLKELAAPFAPEKVLRWTDILLDALSYLHNYKPEPIIHRDIKPSNLKLTANDEIILLDFGLAKGKAGQMSSLGTQKSFFGYTPFYAPIEQIVRADARWYTMLSKANASELKRFYDQGTDPRCDLFSLGSTLYHLLTGNIARDATGKDHLDAPTRVLSIWAGQPDPLIPANEVHSQVTPAIAAVLSRAMALDRKDRFNTAQEMLEALRQASKSQPAEDKKQEKMDLPPTIISETIPSSPPLPYIHRSQKSVSETLSTVVSVKYGILGKCDDAVRSVAYSPNGMFIASGSNDNLIRLWETKTGAVRVLGQCDLGVSGFSYVSSVRFAPNGQRLASGSNDKSIRLWDVETGEMSILGTMSHPIRAIDFSPDGKKIVAGSGDGTIHILDVETKQIQVVGQCEGVVWAVAFSPNGGSLASESDDNTIRIWNIRTLRMRLLASQTTDIRSLAYSPDGKSLAFGGWDQTIGIVDVKTGKIRILGTCEGVVRAVAFSPDGKCIAAGSDDKTIGIWNVETGQVQMLGTCDDVASTVAFSPDGRSLASGSWDTTVRIWRV
ncbi:MAG: serine/threonine protein kinase [Pyrinomonadaceae bacterium]|nr:serine/threonine protein kinase [Pyrinomonadaceae bacterium]